MKRKITRLVPLPVGRAYYHKKYFRRFDNEEFQREMHDHVTGGPASMAEWEFRHLANLKSESYFDALTELERIRTAVAQISQDISGEQRAQLERVVEKLEKSAKYFLESALGSIEK